MIAASTRVLDGWRRGRSDSPILLAESAFLTSGAVVSSSPGLCGSLLALLDSAKIPVEDLLAGPENDTGTRLDVFKGFPKVAQAMGRAHDVRVYHQRHDPRRFRCIGIQLLELIDG